MHGGMKVYRGSAAAARCYVEADRSRADDYYLAEGTGLADRYVATAGPASGRVRVVGEGERAGRGFGGTLMNQRPAIDGDAYERWVAGYDVEAGADTGVAKGRLRKDGQGVRFVEVVVNGPKTWSLAAAVHPEVAAAYDGAQERAAREVIGWLVEHSTTRVGPRGRQVQVPVEELEAAVVRHFTSRAGDPHRHLHLQVNARVKASGGWRGIHTVGVRDSLDAINGIGHAAVIADPEFRAVLAAHGYHLNLESGEIVELVGFIGAFSGRTAQIGRNVDRYEAQWRTEHPGEEPGAKLQRAWDARAWADARPDKVVPRDGRELGERWVEELAELGFRPPERPVGVGGTSIGALDREGLVERAMTRLGARRSAWNAADVRGEIEQLIARAGVVVEGGVRRELAEDLTARALERCVPLLDRDDVPEHIRALTSPRVVAVEDDLALRLSRRTRPTAIHGDVDAPGLDPAQRAAAAAITGTDRLVVVEGAAGAGKTAMLAAAHRHLAGERRRLVVVTPTLKAAQVARGEVGGDAFSAAWLIHQHGFRWDTDGHWTRERQSEPPPQACLRPGDVLVVDEAGMLDQDTARALLVVADEAFCSIALVGDRHQLPAVGRGGVLDHAARWTDPHAVHVLDEVHRFADPSYAALTLLMRTGERSDEVFNRLLQRGEIAVHASDAERRQALASVDGLLIADGLEDVAELNAAVRQRRMIEGTISAHATITDAGERLAVGDRVATRRNAPALGVANRDTWTITATGADGSITVGAGRRSAVLPHDYVAHHVQLAYATTVYGAQGVTVDTAHFTFGEQTGAASAYVAMTRGRHHNVAHLVADDINQARAQWAGAFSRDRADLGPSHAVALARQDLERYGPTGRLRRIGNGPDEHLTGQRHALEDPIPASTSARLGSRPRPAR
ncbi:AAA family ATPase [Nocardioides mangrovicus]|uniref:AAA family ATPase n=1 Tax=Nocardioides mangrovicus TaxID=2478913 RepID=A0A3L8P316_9ACTN|nr:MobF family relaxase [Nocardioides mangrovicus]RLV49730.1 AAA family ATPase [Nocardioides mangrovicus]